MSKRKKDNKKENKAARRGSAEESGSSRTMTRVLVGVAAVAILVVGWNVVGSALDETVRQPVELPPMSAQELAEEAQPVYLGEESAPITIMDFSDYSCPSCRQFATQIKPRIQLGYFDEGLARFAYYDFPLPHFPNSFLAARAARCAGDQDGYWPFHDELFRNQPQWSVMADPVSTFEGYAQGLGLDRGEFRDCLRSDRHAEVVTANRMLGQQLGVGGTPTIFVNSGEGRALRLEQWGDLEAVRNTLDETLARLGHATTGEEGDEEGAAGEDR